MTQSVHMPGVVVDRETKERTYLPLCGQPGIRAADPPQFRQVRDLECAWCLRYARQEEYDADQRDAMQFYAAN